ncbi:MAG: hypothetical protein JWN69_689 [Alphaproteobacteria bacterium]|nr:hypothetical protein [Alphaproteobacteria bacterium]
MSFRAASTVVAALAGAAFLAGPPAHAASFNCGKPRYADERAICASRALNDRDVTMSLLFDLDRSFLAMGGRGALTDGQAAWLRQRRACGSNRSCLARLYDRRIAELRTVIDKQVIPNGPF